jgi:poly(3-hydroxybutyrate) depolymerase
LSATRLAAIIVLAVFTCARSVSAQPELPHGAVIERVECMGDATQTYALYVPSGYSSARRWTVLLAFDPAARGRVMVEKYRAAAEQYGVVVAASNNSRNGPVAISNAAAQAMIRDVSLRFSVDPQRLYLTGLSGGARVAMGIALGGNNIAGVIASSAGFPDSQPRGRVDFICTAPKTSTTECGCSTASCPRRTSSPSSSEVMRCLQTMSQWKPSSGWKCRRCSRDDGAVMRP